jgi:DNA-binding IclR family transcriptional regulator
MESLPKKSDATYQLQSLDRAIAVLDLLGASDRPLSLADICQQMDIHKSTAHRALMVLERNALIERTPENRFRLGLKLYKLGNRAVEQIDLRTHVHPFFSRLAHDLGEPATIHLSVLRRTSIVYLDKLAHSVGGSPYVCKASHAGTSNPVYCTSMGKAMLAFQPLETVERVISKIQFVRYTQKTLCSREALLNALETVRHRGYAVDDEEIELGVRCVGAPIFNHSGRAIAALSVSGPVSHITVQSVASIADRILRCSRDISASLGSAPDIAAPANLN